MDRSFAASPALHLSAAMLCVACSDEAPTDPGGGVGGSAACVPGELMLEDGSCAPAGIPPGRCGEGFAHDGDVGCVPVLPEEPCAAGMMAIPGETACREVAPCGAGTWGSIPVDDATEFVNVAYALDDSDGSQERPWRSLAEAVAAATPGATIAVAAGTYSEDVDVEGKPVRIWGVCPALTVLAAWLGVRNAAASGTEIHDLSIIAGGLLVTGASSVVADRLWIHTSLFRGIQIVDDTGVAEATVHGTLVENVRELGMYVYGSRATISESVVRGTQPRLDDDMFGRGISAERDVGMRRAAELILVSSLIERCHDIGLHVAGAKATIDALVVRDTYPNAATGADGRGINIQAEPMLDLRSTATVRGVVVERSHAQGLVLSGSDGVLESIVVRDTAAELGSMKYGFGIAIQNGQHLTANATLRFALSERNHEIGVYVRGSDAVLEGFVARDTLPRRFELSYGRGLHIQPERTLGIRSQVDVRGAVIERNSDVAALVYDSDFSVETTSIRDTSAKYDGTFGDGISVFSDVGGATAIVTGSEILRSARAGIANFSAEVALETNVFECNQFDLNGEVFADAGPFAFDDLGHNVCGCNERSTCKWVSSQLEPPEVPDTP